MHSYKNNAPEAFTGSAGCLGIFFICIKKLNDKLKSALIFIPWDQSVLL